MASLLGHLHFWTLKKDTLDTVSAHGVGSYRYHTGKGSSKPSSGACQNQPYYEELRAFTEDRGFIWSPGKKRPDKVRETLKELEELLANLRCVYCAWHNRNHLKLMLNSGVVIVIRVKAGVGDIEKITTDKFLVGKLHSDHIVDVVFNETSILVSYVEPKLTLVKLTKKASSSTTLENASKKWEKLSSLDAKISHVDLMGPVGRRLERKLSCNIRNDQILIWWTSSGDEVWPWRPISADRDRANIHVYMIADGASGVKLACQTRTKGDLIWVSYGRLHTYRFHSIEQRMSRKGDISVDICVYEILSENIQRVSVTKILIESAIVCHAMNDAEDRLTLGCKDGSLVVYDAHCKATGVIRASFIPSTIGWHSSGTVFVVSSDDGAHLECYDLALCRINLKLVSDDNLKTSEKSINLAAFFGSRTCSVQRLMWMPQQFAPKDAYGYSDNSHSLLISIERGPLAFLVLRVGVHGDAGRSSLSPVELSAEYLNHGQVDEAVTLLMNLNWNVASETSYMCMSLVVNRLLKTRLTTETEVQLEKALGTFYSPSYPLSDVVLLEYGNRLRCVARRFFHHLLRHERFEKAFLLAADIGSPDLFMDIHYVASDKREKILAQAALDRARQLDVGSDSSSSVASKRGDEDVTSTSSSGCSRTSSEDDERDVQTQRTPLNVQSGPRAAHKDPMRDFMMPQAWPSTVDEHAWRPVQSSVPAGELDTFEVEEDDEGHGTVHVVHFGVV